MRARRWRAQQKVAPPIRRRAGKNGGRRGSARWIWLGASTMLFVLSLGAAVRVNALPAEARTQETWYAYQQELRYDFSARVQSGQIYSRDLVGSGDLLQNRLPVEPPVYRRVVVGPLAESIRIILPYRYVADREALIRMTYRVDGEIRVPNYWRKDYPLVSPRTVVVRAAELRVEDLAVEIPVRAIREELGKLTQDLKISFDQVEVRVRPVFQLEVEGQREPISPVMKSEYLLWIRNGGAAIELDEPRTEKDAQQYQTDERTPLSVDLWGRQVPVTLFQQVIYAGLGLFALLLAVVGGKRWLNRRREAGDALHRLGNGRIQASEVALPEGAVVVEVANLDQLILLHLQTERPVVQVGRMLYVIDGRVCYRHEGRAS